jgi:hypothetical protein
VRCDTQISGVLLVVYKFPASCHWTSSVSSALIGDSRNLEKRSRCLLTGQVVGREIGLHPRSSAQSSLSLFRRWRRPSRDFIIVVVDRAAIAQW